MMSPFFDKAFQLVIGSEGGYVNDPADPGGETKYGISKRAYPLLDIAALTLEEAKGIYLRDYWLPAGCDALPWGSAYALFDTAVNCGLHKAAELKAKSPQGGGFLVSFLTERILYYVSLPTFARFGRGWVSRVLRLVLAAVG